MKFYRRYTPPVILSFDLDDTLYNNEPIIWAAEQKTVEYLAQLSPDFAHKSIADWQHEKAEFAHNNPKLSDDVSQLRLAFFNHIFIKHNIANAAEQAQKAYQFFFHCRNDFTVPKTVVDLLTTLKKYFILVAVTNGNAEPNLIGLQGLFEHVLKPTNGVKMKPAPDMLLHLCKQYSVSPKQILHIGDSITSDIGSAQNAGCQSAWFNPKRASYTGVTLPDIELHDINELLAFSGANND